MKKDELIIEMNEGVMLGVYSLNPTLLNVRLYDDEDIGDTERQKEFWRNKLLVEHGCVGDITSAETDKSSQIPLTYTGGDLDVFFNMIAGNDLAGKKLDFLMGFLYAWSTAYREIANLCHSKNDENKSRGKELFEAVKPTLQFWLNTYDDLFDDLWSCVEMKEDK